VRRPRKLSSSVDDSCPAGNERGPKGRRERPKKTTPGSPSTWNARALGRARDALADDPLPLDPRDPEIASAKHVIEAREHSRMRSR